MELISLWWTRTTCSLATHSQFPLIQVSLWRAQMCRSSLEESWQKSKTNSTANSGVGGGGGSFQWSGAAKKNPHEEHEQFFLKCGHERKGCSIELPGKILVNLELVFMCSLGNLRNEQQPLCGNRGQVHGPLQWKHNKTHILTLFRAILHDRQWQRALIVMWSPLTLNSEINS